MNPNWDPPSPQEMVEVAGVEPAAACFRSRRLTPSLHLDSDRVSMGREGHDPSPFGLKVRRSARLSYRLLEWDEGNGIRTRKFPIRQTGELLPLLHTPIDIDELGGPRSLIIRIKNPTLCPLELPTRKGERWDSNPLELESQSSASTTSASSTTRAPPGTRTRTLLLRTETPFHLGLGYLGHPLIEGPR